MWLYKQSKYSDWALKVARYLEIAEAKWSIDGYLKEGALTLFSGIPFSDDNLYNYPEAKRLLGLLMYELRDRKDLENKLGMNPQGAGRGAITGRDGVSVWDFLRLEASSGEESFTKYPHLTLAIERDRILTIITIPHGINATFRRSIVDLGFEGFSKKMAEVNNNLRKVLCKTEGAAPWVVVVQRRYPTQRSAAIMDARIEYDLRTAFPSKGKQPVKVQQEWLKATYEALSRKRSNLQVAVGAVFPYRTCGVTRNRSIVGSIVSTWVACKPLIDALLINDEAWQQDEKERAKLKKRPARA